MWVNWQPTGPPAAQRASACWPVRLLGHDADPRHPPDGPSAEWCGRSVPASGQPISTWRPGTWPHRPVPKLAAALTVGVVALVPPNLLGFFFENQQGRGFSQRLVLASEFLLQIADTFGLGALSRFGLKANKHLVTPLL